MDKKQNENKPVEDDLDLDMALDEFDNELNLTGEEVKPGVEEDPATAAKIKEEYEKFMKQMQNFGLSGEGEDEGMQNLTSMLGGLLTQLTGESGLEGQHGDMTKGFEQMFKSLKQENIQQAAGKLLSQFMDKNILHEPLVEAKQNYEVYFKKQEGKIPKEDEERYRKQYALLTEIVGNLESTQQQTPAQKQQLIQMFEKMQELGQPPQGISAPGQLL